MDGVLRWEKRRLLYAGRSIYCDSSAHLSYRWPFVAVAPASVLKTVSITRSSILSLAQSPSRPQAHAIFPTLQNQAQSPWASAHRRVASVGGRTAFLPSERGQAESGRARHEGARLAVEGLSPRRGQGCPGPRVVDGRAERKRAGAAFDFDKLDKGLRFGGQLSSGRIVGKNYPWKPRQKPSEPGAGRRRIAFASAAHLLTMVGLAVLFASIGAIGCGGGSGGGGGGGGGIAGTSAGTYTVTVTGTGTSSGSSNSVTATVGTVTLTVN